MPDSWKYGGMLMLSLWLTSCNTVSPLCVSPCGTRLMGVLETGEMPNGWSCEGLIKAENTMGAVTDPAFTNACVAAKDVEIYHQPMTPFTYRGEAVEGSAFCDRHLIVLSSLPLEQSAYAHEMFHIIQGCKAPLPADKGLDEDHANWNRDRIYSAINRWHLMMQEDN